MGPVAPSDEPCAKPGSEPSLASAQGQRWSLGWVFFYIPKKASAGPHLLFLQRLPYALFSAAWEDGKAWSWLLLPLAPTILGSELRHYFRLVSGLSGRMAILVLFTTTAHPTTSAGLQVTSQT